MTKTIQTEGVPETHRERILSAAAESFLELGFERTSTAEIARRAKVSKREIYAYFDDKRAILTASITELQGEMQSQMGGIWTSSEDLEVVLPKAAKILTKYILSDRFSKLLRIVATDSYHNPQAATQFFEMGPNVGRKATATYMKSQMNRGKLRKADPLKAADDFLDLVIGAQLMTAVILGQVDRAPLRRDHIKHAVEMFMKNYATS
jgi:TetR/AcrR family transcriptional repressor of mexJK operon